jgi:hypothetical protein
MAMQKKHMSWALLVDHAATAWQPYYVAFVWLAIAGITNVFFWQVVVEVTCTGIKQLFLQDK